MKNKLEKMFTFGAEKLLHASVHDLCLKMGLDTCVTHEREICTCVFVYVHVMSVGASRPTFLI